MKSNKILSMMMLASMFTFLACEQESFAPQDEVSPEVLSKLVAAGFDISDQAPIKFEQGYLVEGDIYIPAHEIDLLNEGNRIPQVEQYHTTNLVNAGSGRLITIFAPISGRNAYSSGMIAGFDLAISRYNAENLTITFQRVTSSTGASIVVSRLSKGDESRGVLGSAGFPTSTGDPYNKILMSGVLESNYGLTAGGIATIFGHEVGHCIGFRHTDYFNRAISCGGSTSNEGASTVGAIHIPGTPTGATLSAKSWMLACTDGSDRPFNADDKTALNYLY